MKKVLYFIKDKSYYFLGVTIFIIVMLIVINSCSLKKNGADYESLENEMIEAAKKYYQKYPQKLPNQDNNEVRVTISSLIEAELLENLKDPKKKDNICSGYVEITKVGNDYSYIPFLTCPGSYEPKLLVEEIKNSKLDEYGNGVYTLGKELVYRGDSVNNYVLFSGMLWRIVSVDEVGDIKIVLAKRTDEFYVWDSKYNSEDNENSGINNDYFHSNIRKVLVEFYNNKISTDDKGKISTKTICVGSILETDDFNREKECRVTKENENIMLLNVYDYGNASLDENCKNLKNGECTNYNYLTSNYYFNTWLLTPDERKSYKCFSLNRVVRSSISNVEKHINPVVYLNNKVLINGGKGTENNPYVIK